MRFIVNAQLPAVLAQVLREEGHESAHVVGLGMHKADDSSIWEYASEENNVILTKDEDFPHRLSQNPQKAPTIVWLRIGNTGRRALLKWFYPILPKLNELIQGGENLIELR